MIVRSKRILPLAFGCLGAFTSLKAAPAATTQAVTRMVAAMQKLEQFTVDIAGTVDASSAGMPVPMGSFSGPQKLKATLSVDRRKSAANPSWKAIASLALPLPGGARPIDVTAVSQGQELFLSTLMPLPGMGVKTLAFRVAAPNGNPEKTPAKAPPQDWLGALEKKLETASTQEAATLSLQGQTLSVLVKDKSGVAQTLQISWNKQNLPARLIATGGSGGGIDLTLSNYRVGPVDLSLPLAKENYSALSLGMLSGMASMMGGGAAPAAKPAVKPSSSRSPFAKSPFARFPFRSPVPDPKKSARPAIPVPSTPTPAAPNMAGMLQGLMKGLGSAMTPPAEGTTPSKVPGLNFSENTRKLLEHMRKLRTGETQGSIGTGNSGEWMKRLMQLPSQIGKIAQEPSIQDDIAKKALPFLNRVSELLKQSRENQGKLGGTGGNQGASQAMQGMFQALQGLAAQSKTPKGPPTPPPHKAFSDMLDRIGSGPRPDVGLDLKQLEEVQKKVNAAVQRFRESKPVVKPLESMDRDEIQKLQDMLEKLKRTAPLPSSGK